MMSQDAPAGWKALKAGRNRGGAAIVRGPELQNEQGLAKRYRGVPTVTLPTVDLPATPLGSTLKERVSCRQFGAEPLTLSEVTTILEASYGSWGIGETPAGAMLERPVPSGGARFPLEVYLIVRRAEGLTPGVYHYVPEDRLLETLRGPLPWASIVRLFLDQPYLARVDTLMVLTAMAGRTLKRYGERGFRFLWLEAGHAVQNGILASTALGLGSLPLAGFYDEPLAGVLGVSSETEPPLYALALGRSPVEDRAERRKVI